MVRGFFSWFSRATLGKVVRWVSQIFQSLGMLSYAWFVNSAMGAWCRRVFIPHWQNMWQDEKKRGRFLQNISIFVVLFIFLYFLSNVISNFALLSKSFGFGFLLSPANYDINQHMALIPYQPSDSHLWAALVGVLGTIYITAWGCLLAVIMGFLIGLARLSPNFLLSRLALIYIETIRNIPLLIQIILWNVIFISVFPPPEQAIAFAGRFYLSNDGLAMPKFIFAAGGKMLLVALAVMVFGWFMLKKLSLQYRFKTGQALHPVLFYGVWFGLVALPIVTLLFFVKGQWQVPVFGEYTFENGALVPSVFASLLFGLGFFTASYVAETVRGALLAINKGQTEAGMAIGLSRGQINRLVLIPQALRMIIPPLSSEMIGLLKNSALAVAVGYVDIGTTLVNSTLNITGREMECMLLAMSFYLILSLSMSLMINYYNKRISLRM
ncbi:MAG: amino acid ABC transporter permease [Alphaproteobacteria bacterium]